jgi:hypothetical protein
MKGNAFDQPYGGPRKRGEPVTTKPKVLGPTVASNGYCALSNCCGCCRKCPHCGAHPQSFPFYTYNNPIIWNSTATGSTDPSDLCSH